MKYYIHHSDQENGYCDSWIENILADVTIFSHKKMIAPLSLVRHALTNTFYRSDPKFHPKIRIYVNEY